MTALPAVPLPATRFTMRPGAEATSPPERRGIARDEVRLLVARSAGLRHTVFSTLPDALAPGDLLVINTSATIPAALVGELDDGRHAPVHLSTVLDDGSWIVEVRAPDGSGPDLSVRPGDTIRLPGSMQLLVQHAYPDPGATSSRLWRTTPAPATDVLAYLAAHGSPIEYAYLRSRHPLSDHQTVYATQPGSAEMVSAGRPFTAALLTRLVAAGVTIAPVVLHCGVSSPDAGEPPLPERFEVPAATARLVMSARAAGNRVVAVGTTVVRALETVASPGGEVHARTGWTDLVLGPDRPARVVTGLVTGLHAPQASHLLLLEAVAGEPLVAAAYAAAVERRYLWHEFGDSMLFLP